MAFSTILAGGAALKGLQEGFSSSESSKKLAKKAIKIQEGTLEFARQKFKLFEPIIKSTTDFFGKVPLDDIVSGRILTPETRAELENIGQITFNLNKEQEEDLIRRGVENDPGSLALRNEIKLGSRTAKSEAINRGIQNRVNQNLQLTQVGLNQVSDVINTAGNLSNLVTGLSQGEAAKASSGFQSAGVGLGHLASGTPSPSQATPAPIQSSQLGEIEDNLTPPKLSLRRL